MNIIPQPVRIFQRDSNKFSINTSDCLLINFNYPGINQVAQYLQSTLIDRYKLNCQPQLLQHHTTPNNIFLSLVSEQQLEQIFGNDKWQKNSLKNESYCCEIAENGILINACASKGLFYGVQTLLQLFPTKFEEQVDGISLPCAKILDYPRFGWRGMLLDVGRHFFSTACIKQMLDVCAMHKINVFHWHLTEDQGWRIEIQAYPKLKEMGSWREKNDEKDVVTYRKQGDNDSSDSEGSNSNSQFYGGHYTQHEIKEIVQYAQQLFIDVMPEIEMPGHCCAALACYPHLSCRGDCLEVPNTWGVKEDVYCAGNDEVFEFLENVLSEVIELFPFEYIHIGCDEVPKDRWQECTKCQARIEKEKLKNECQLQSWFVWRINQFLKSKGRKIICWDEALEGGLVEGCTVMSWRGVQGGMVAAEHGHDVIMTPTSYCYLDYRQSTHSVEEPGTWYAVLKLEKVYQFDPIPTDSSQDEDLQQTDDQTNKKSEVDLEERILGGQGNLWTEFVPDVATAQYMLLPRLTALSEALWSQPQQREWSGFRTRLKHILQFYDSMDLYYRPLDC